jgi:hypothetical protein
MRRSRFLLALSSALFLSLTMLACPANAEMGVGLRGGSFGFGLDFDVNLAPKANLRLGYNGFNYSTTVDDTDVRYDSTIKISSFSALLDWHAFGGGFRFSLGAVNSGPKVEVNGTPAPGTSVELNGRTYTSSEVGSLRGEIKIANSVAPYLGIGWGNVVSEKHRVTFLVDIGAIYGGTPDVSLTAVCGSAISASRCAQLQADTQREIQDLKDNASDAEWYPVLSLGIGIRF